MVNSYRELLEVKEQLKRKDKTFSLIVSFIEQRLEINKALEDQYSDSITTLLRREQAIGAVKELKTFVSELDSFINTKLQEAKEKEDNAQQNVQ